MSNDPSFGIEIGDDMVASKATNTANRTPVLTTGRNRNLPKPAPQVPLKYTINDPNCRSMAGQKIAVGQTTIMLTPREAKFFVASGALVPFVG